MKVSWNWLATYLRIDVSVETLAERLALTGLNCESIADVDGDLQIDLEVTSNRSDCLGHIGVAREIAAVLNHPEAPLQTPLARTRHRVSPNVPHISAVAAVENRQPDACPRFTARLVSGVRVGPSPWWLRRRLKTVGQDSVNNVVDITNYVLLERGQPLHAYDFERLEGRKLVVRNAAPGETLVGLDKKTHALRPDMLVIADAVKPVALAGVMGGLETGITPDTTSVLVESAAFHPLLVRRAARALGLATESSYRFERPIDPEALDWASHRCVEMILDLCGGKLHEGVIDTADGRQSETRPSVSLRLDQIPRVLGIDVPLDEVRRILRALGLVERPAPPNPVALDFHIPSWRPDLEREIDLVEEVARVYGYEHIPEDRAVPMIDSRKTPRERVENILRESLVGLGFDEVYTFSMVGPDLALTLPVEPEPESPSPTELARRALPPLATDHSIRKRENLLRTSLAPSLLRVRQYNEARGNHDAEIFEIAHVFLPRLNALLPDEPPRLGVVSGRDFLGLKGVLEAILERLHVGSELEAAPVDQHPLAAPGRAAVLSLNGEPLGSLAEVAENVRARFDLRKPCSVLEINLEPLVRRHHPAPQLKPVPEFPPVARELSLVLPDHCPWAAVREVARDAGGPHLESIQYLDTFRGGNLPPRAKSLHFGMTFRDPARTLTGEQADAAVNAILHACRQRLGAELRA